MSFPPETLTANIELARPNLAALPCYVRALREGWSPDNVGGKATADRQLACIDEDAPAFIASLDDPEGRGAAFVLPDGTTAKRLPGYVLWIWDSDFCGSISLRWQPGVSDLPDYVLGHKSAIRSCRGNAAPAMRPRLLGCCCLRPRPWA